MRAFEVRDQFGLDHLVLSQRSTPSPAFEQVLVRITAPLVVTSGVFRVGAESLPGDGVFIGKPYAVTAPVRIIRELIRQKAG